jgi:hypothetical protein
MLSLIAVNSEKDILLNLTPWVPNDGDLRLCVRNGSVPIDGDLRRHNEFQISHQLSSSQHTQRESTIYKSNIGQPALYWVTVGY